jgi:hypothetical protein
MFVCNVDLSRPFSYRYNFDTDDWNAIYKYTMGKNFKVKAGYDSAVRVGWASLWVRTLKQLYLQQYIFSYAEDECSKYYLWSRSFKKDTVSI